MSEVAGMLDGSWSLDRARLRPVSWLWRDWIALGKPTTLDGDPGMGKSTILAAELAARVSVGASMPDDTPGLDRPENVLLASAEDDPADTIAPRIVAAGGDLTRVWMVRLRSPDDADRLEGILPPTGDDPDRGTRSMVLPDDLATLAAMLYRHRPALCVIDPVVAYLGGSVDSHRDQDVRRVLMALAEIAARSGAAIVATRHLNKSSGTSALYRGGGSIGFIAAVRTGLLVATDPDDATRSILSVVKSNVGRIPESLAYRIVPHLLDHGGVLVETSRIEWLGPVAMAAGDLLAGDAEERGAMADAREWLRAKLADGPVAARDAEDEAINGVGITRATLARARKAEGVVAERVGGLGREGHWQWSLPAKALTESRRHSPSESEALRDSVSALGAADTHGYATFDAFAEAQRSHARPPNGEGTSEEHSGQHGDCVECHRHHHRPVAFCIHCPPATPEPSRPLEPEVGMP